MKTGRWILTAVAQCVFASALPVGATTLTVTQTQVHITGDWLNGSYNDYAPSYATDSGSFTNPNNGLSVTATSVADLSRGHLGALGLSYTTAARASAEFVIQLSADGPLSSPGMVVMTIHGSLDSDPTNGFDDATASLDVNNQVGTYNCDEALYCLTQPPIVFFFDSSARIDATLSVEGRNADFLNSAEVSVFVPGDVTLLNTPGFIHAGTAAPEPGVPFLFSDGVAIIVGLRRSRWLRSRLGGGLR